MSIRDANKQEARETLYKILEIIRSGIIVCEIEEYNADMRRRDGGAIYNLHVKLKDYES